MNNKIFHRDDKWLYFLLSTLALPGADLNTHIKIANWKYETGRTPHTRILPRRLAKLLTPPKGNQDPIQVSLPDARTISRQGTEMCYYQTEITPLQNLTQTNILENLTTWYISLNYQIYNDQKTYVDHTKKIINLDKNKLQSIPILIHHLAHILLKHPLENPCNYINEYIATNIEYYYLYLLEHTEKQPTPAPGYNYAPNTLTPIITEIRTGIYQIAQIISVLIEPDIKYDELQIPAHQYIEQTIGCSSWGYPAQILVGFLPGDCSYELSKYLKNSQIAYKAINLESDSELRQKAKQFGYTVSPVIYSLNGTPIAGYTYKPAGTPRTIAKTLFTIAWQKIGQIKTQTSPNTDTAHDHKE